MRKIYDQDAGPEHYPDFVAQLDIEGNDRSVAILLATTVESALQVAITRRMGLTKSGVRELFSSRGPLYEFNSKILIAHRLGIFGPETRTNLDIVKHIRNIFAHARVPISFSTQEIIDTIRFMVVPEKFEPRGMIPRIVQHDIADTRTEWAPDRKKFREVCAITGHNLIMKTLGGNLPIEPAAVSVPLDDDYRIWATPLPLP